MKPMTRRIARCGRVVATALILLSSVTSTCTGTLTGGAGFDYQTGPGTQSYRSALLFGYAEGTTWDATVAGIRYGDSRVGPGIGFFANGSAPLGPHARARGIALRAIGDDTYRAWRWRVGPEFRLPSDRVLGAYYLRLTNNLGESFGSLGAELSSPITTSVTGQIGSSYGEWRGGATSAQGSVSGIWRPAGHMLLLAEFDVGRNLVTTTAAGPGGGGGLGGLPIVGGLGGGHGKSGNTTETSSEITGAGQIGIRFLLR